MRAEMHFRFRCYRTPLFVTGYGQAILPRDRPTWEACSKPFHPDELTERIAQKINSD